MDLSFLPVPIAYDIFVIGIVSAKKLLIGCKKVENRKRWHWICLHNSLELPELLSVMAK